MIKIFGASRFVRAEYALWWALYVFPLDFWCKVCDTD